MFTTVLLKAGMSWADSGSLYIRLGSKQQLRVLVECECRFLVSSCSAVECDSAQQVRGHLAPCIQVISGRGAGAI
jgi:hypothetical protein